jgi:hypothetical protein
MTTASSPLYARGLSASTASGDSGSLDTTWLNSLRLDYNVTAFTNGTTPSITFTVEVLGANGLWYAAYTTAAITATGAGTRSIGPGLDTPGMLTAAARVRWAFGGAVVADSITFSLAVSGRN